MSPQQLSRTQVRAFIDDGLVRIDRAFSHQPAAEARGILPTPPRIESVLER